MASAASEAAVAGLTGDARAAVRDGEDFATAAWLCALPCAAIVAVAILVLGPPLGQLLSPASSPYTFLAGSAAGIHPEPTEHARYLIALAAPLLGALAVASAPRWLARVPPAVAASAVAATQWTLAIVVVASIVVQYRLRFGEIYTRGLEPTLELRYFTPTTLAVAALLAVAVTAAARREHLRARAAAVLRETRARRIVLTAVAAAATAIWALHAVHSDASIANAVEDVRYHLGFTIDETFAVLNGRTPLVDFSAQYGSLWPFVIALPMLAFGETALTFTVVLCTLTALALFAIYDVLRRATRSSATALLLYLPFLATSLYQAAGTLANRSSAGTYYANFPLRYAGPYLVAWLVARQLERGGDRALGTWLLFTAAGLALLNNGDFGLAALGASVAALLWTAPELSRRALLRLAGCVLAGVATAFALVSLLTLVRAGSLPQPGRLVEYARTYAVGGFAMMPIPGVLGMHLLVYLTYVAAIVVATVRAATHASNRVLTGMLAWSGVFGLGAGMYWVGRSHPVALKYQFSAWALALVLLTVVAATRVAASRGSRPAIAAVVVLFGFGVTVCSLAQTPMPWSQVERLQAPFVATEEVPDADPLVPPADAATRRFVTSLADGPGRFVAQPGAPVAILLTTGHRVADAYGVTNVSAYTGIESLQTEQRVERVLDTLRAAGGNTVILPNPLDPAIFKVLERRGFGLLTPDGPRPYVAGKTRPIRHPWPGGGTVIKWVDTRHLHAEALR